jgi:hypothetical protein
MSMTDNDFTAEAEGPVHPSEAEFDRALTKELDAWGNAGSAAQPEPEDEPEAAPAEATKPSRKASKASRELAERPDFSDEPDDEAEGEEQVEAKKASKKEGADDDQEDRRTKAPRDVKPAKAGKEGNDADADRKAKDDELQRELDELDRLDPQSMKPAQRANWKALKSVAKASKAEAKQRAAELEALRAEHEAYKSAQENPQKPPAEIEAELEQHRREVAELRAHKAKYDITTSPDFQQRFQVPVNEALSSLLMNIVDKRGGGDKEHQEWANKVWLAEMQGKLPPEYWHTQILDDLAAYPDLKKDTVERIVKYQQLKEGRNHAEEQLTRSPALASQWYQHTERENIERLNKGIQLALPQLQGDLGPWAQLPEDEEAIKAIKDPQERARVEKVTKHFHTELWPTIQRTLEDMNCPDYERRGKAQAIVTAKAIDRDYIKQVNKELREENRRLLAENRRFHAVRGVPAKAAGVLGRSKSGPSVDIFSDKPASWDMGDDD